MISDATVEDEKNECNDMRGMNPPVACGDSPKEQELESRRNLSMIVLPTGKEAYRDGFFIHDAGVWFEIYWNLLLPFSRVSRGETSSSSVTQERVIVPLNSEQESREKINCILDVCSCFLTEREIDNEDKFVSLTGENSKRPLCVQLADHWIEDGKGAPDRTPAIHLMDSSSAMLPAWISSRWWLTLAVGIGLLIGKKKVKTISGIEVLEDQTALGLLGVGLCRVPQLSKLNFDSCLYTKNALLHVVFPLGLKWSAISKFICTKLFGPQDPVKTSLDPLSIPWIILHEAFRCRAFGVPLMVSLHRQDPEKSQSELHSIMHPMLRKTIIGYVIGFLDFFLKGYINGGAYSEDFLLHYGTSKGNDNLHAQLIDFQKELLSIRKAREGKGQKVDGLPLRYICLSDMVEEEGLDVAEQNFFAQNYTFSYNIFGAIQKVRKSANSILEPECTTEIESEIEAKPALGSQISEQLKGGSGDPGTKLSSFLKVHSRMQREIDENIIRHPRIQPYFEILKIITFCAALANSLYEAGIHPKIPASVHSSISASTHLVPFPHVLPPLPVRRGPLVCVEVSFDDMAKEVCVVGKQSLVNKMIRNEVSSISMEERTSALLFIARETVKRVMRKAAPDSASTAALDELDDGTLQVEKVASTFRHFLQRIVCLALLSKAISMMKGMCKIFVSRALPLLDPKEIDDNSLETYEDFRAFLVYGKESFLKRWGKACDEEINNQREEAQRSIESKMQSRAEVEAEIRKELDVQISEQIEESLQKLRVKLEREFVRKRPRNPLSATSRSFPQEMEGAVTRELQAARASMEKDADRKKMKIIKENVGRRMESLRMAINEAKRSIEKNSRETLKKVQQLSKELVDELNGAQNRMQRDPLGQYLKLNYGFKCTLAKNKIKLGYTDVPTTEDSTWGMSGGCGLRDNSVIIENNSAVFQRHNTFCGSTVIFGGERVDDKDKPYFQLGIPLQYHFAGGAKQFPPQYHYCYSSEAVQGDARVLDRCRDVLTRFVSPGTCDKIEQEQSIRDSFGFHSAHYAVCLSSSQLDGDKILPCPKSLLHEPSVDGILPLHLACMVGNHIAVAALIQEGVNVNALLPSRLTPLLIAAQFNFHKVAILLLSNGSEVNVSTESGVTPLHWAVHHGNDVLTTAFLSSGALCTAQRRSDGATPIHLAARGKGSSCLVSLVSKYPNFSSLLSHSLRSPLHDACCESRGQNALLLLSSITSNTEREMALFARDQFGFTPITLSVFTGHISTALKLCEIAGIKSIGQMAGYVPHEDRDLFLRSISEHPILAAYFSVPCAEVGEKEALLPPAQAHPATSFMPSSPERLIKRCSSEEEKQQEILSCICERDTGFLKQLSLHSALGPSDFKVILRAVATYGLLDWPETLSNCGVDVCAPINDKGDTLLYLAGAMEDELLMKAVWKEFSRFIPKDHYYSHIVSVLYGLPMNNSGVWEALADILQNLDGNPPVGVADPLLRDASVTTSKWAFARHFGLQPSKDGVIKAPKTCRPTVLQALLSEGVGLQEEVQLHMLQEALLQKRKDNALIILLNSWPNFEIAAKNVKNKLLAQNIQKLVQREGMAQYKKELDGHEAILRNPLRLQEMNENERKLFFESLSARKFFPMENKLFGVYAWLLANSTEKFRCPWDPEIEDERGMNGYVCSCGCICSNPSNVKKIAASIGVSTEELLRHPSFSTSIRMSNAPFDVIEKLLNAHSSKSIVASCLYSLSKVEERGSRSAWKNLLDNASCIEKELPSTLHTVVCEKEQTTLLMSILPLPEADDIVQIALNTANVSNSLKLRDRFGRSVAHHILSFGISARQLQYPGLADTVFSILTSRLKRVLMLHPPLLHQQDRDGYTLWILAAKHNNTHALSLLSTLSPFHLLDRFVTVSEGWSALHVATESNAKEALRLMILELGANPNRRSALVSAQKEGQVHGITPLHIAARKSDTKLFRLLVDLGADPLQRNSRNETPIHWAVRFGDDTLVEFIYTLPGFWLLNTKGEMIVPLAGNTHLSSFHRAQLLRVTHPNRACRSWKGKSAFLEAAREGDTSVVEDFCAHGADLLSFDAERWNAAHLVCLRGITPMLVRIVQHVFFSYSSKDLENFLLLTNSNGDSPLHFAAQAGSLGCICILLSFECIRKTSISQQNNKGLTPANVAALSGHTEIAILLDELSETKSLSFHALHSTEEDLLKRFWNCVSVEARRVAREKATSIELLNLSHAERNVTYAQASEWFWEKRKNTITSLFVSACSKEGLDEICSHHPVFRADIVKGFLLQSIEARKYDDSITEEELMLGESMVHWCSEEDVPSHASIFFLEHILIWAPLQHWKRIIDLLKKTSLLWSVEKQEYPGVQHAIWRWLRLFFSRHSVHYYFDNRFYEAIGTFLNYLESKKVNFLPPPRVYVGSVEHHGFSHHVGEALEAVNEYLGAVDNADDRALCITHMNTLWYFCQKRTITIPSENHSHWMVSEYQLFHRFGVHIIKPLDFLNHYDEIVEGDTRSFILEMMKREVSQKVNHSTLMAWTTAAVIAISELGLHLTRRVCLHVISAMADLKKNTCLSNAFLPFITSVVQSMVELESEALIMSCLNIPFVQSIDGYMSSVLAALKKKITDKRTARLGEDRPVDELISAFETPSANHKEVEPYLYPFDGTPMITLPPAECTLLRELITVIESFSSTHTASASQIREDAKRAGEEFDKTPTIQLLAQMIALIREAVYRTLQRRPFRIQCMCVAAMFIPMIMMNKHGNADVASRIKGRLAQVATGEGKSIIVSMTAAAFALIGRTVDVITSSGPLAERDTIEFAEFYQFFGFRVSHISTQSPNKNHFNAEIVYGTNTDFEFVQLREGCFMESIRMYDPFGGTSWVDRPKMVAIVDEADNLFLDAAQNSARIAYSTGACFTWVYSPIFDLVRERSGPQEVTVLDVREKLSTIHNGYYAQMTPLLSDVQINEWIHSARIALLHHKRDKQYIVRQQKIVIVDLDTGRLQESSRWGHGIHEMLEVKEGVPVEPESGVIGSIAHPSFFDGYENVFGITGTAGEPEERKEILQLYGIDTFDVPPHRPCLRKRLPTRIFRTKEEKQQAIVQSAVDIKNTSVLILLPTIAESNEIIALLRATKRASACVVLNETQRENEEFVLLKASQPATILVATNTAGRGTDIRLSKKVLDNGGLHVIYGAFPPNLRVECQGIGRCARQGQPGCCQMFISLDEDFVEKMLFCSTAAFSRDLKGHSNEIVKQLYAARTQHVVNESVRRVRMTSIERIHFSSFQHFVEDQCWLKDCILTTSNHETVSAVNEIYSNGCIAMRVSMEELFQRLLECFRVLWVNYYTIITSQRDSNASSEPIDLDSIFQNDIVQFSAVRDKGRSVYDKFLTSTRWTLTKLNKQCIRDALHASIISHIEMIEHIQK